MKRKILGAMSLVLSLPFVGVLHATNTGDEGTVQSLALSAEMQQGKTITVKGHVTDGKGEELIGVNVLVKGSTTGTTTDVNGNFTLRVPSNGTLVLSYVGFANKEIPVGGKTVLKVVMEDDSKAIDEVVVTALGIKRATKALSYNVQEVKNEALTTVKDANFMNSLNGKVAGVNIQRSSGGAGGGTRVVMRGNKSIQGSNNVLYVVDGVPIGNAASTGGGDSAFGGSAPSEGISSFNPEDIESISVLTGPSAAALYGASAANGVIVINTKKGAEGKTSVNVASSVEFANPFVLPKFQDRYGNKPGSYESWGDKLEQPSGYDPSHIFQTGTTFNNSFSLSTGTAKNQTYFSAAAISANGIIDNNKYRRYNVTFRNTSKLLDDKLTLDLSFGYVREFRNNMVSWGTYFNPIVGAYLFPRGEDWEQQRYWERYDAEKGYSVQNWIGDLGMNIENPYWVMYRNIRPSVSDRYMMTGLLRYELTKDLSLTARARLDNTYSESENKRYASTNSVFAKEYGYYSYSNSAYKQKYLDFIASYNKDFAKDWHLSANVGTSYEEYDTKGHGYFGNLFTLPNKFAYSNIDQSKGGASQSGGNDRKENFAVFASAELSFNNYAFLTVTGRGDKPSQLVNAKEEWVFYPSIGLSGVITEMLREDLRNKIRPVVNFFKVRASFTEVGSPIPFTGLTRGTLTRGIGAGSIGGYDFYPPEDFKPERTRSWELGIDSRWLNNSLSLAVTLYRSNTYNQLLKAEAPKGSGYKYVFVQAGDVQNQGIEMTLGFDQKFGKVLDYSTSLTATANRNKIKQLADGFRNPLSGEIEHLTDIESGRFRLRVGGEVGDMYAKDRIARGSDRYLEYTPGSPLLTENTDPYKLGSVNPKWNLGWRNSFKFYGFTLNALVTARIGGIVTSSTQATLDKFGVSEASAEARDRGYVMVGDIKVLPEDYYKTISNLGSYYVYSATNVRLQEVSLAYTLPSKWFGKYLKSVTMSIYGSNLWMIYNKAPYDPELTATTGTLGQGSDTFMLPSQRTVGFSLKVGI